MATLTASSASPVKTGRGFCASPCDDSHALPWDIIATPQELILEAGEFVIASRLGLRRICRLTGRTRWIGSWRAITVETFDVETVVRPLADGTPALWGIRGDRFPGTWAISSQALAD
jgi:hypothetical protein